MPTDNTVTGEAVDPARRKTRSAPTAAKPPPVLALEAGERRRAQDRLSDILILAQTVGQHGIQLAQQGERLDRLETMSTQQGARLDTLDAHLTAQDSRHDTVVTSVNEVKTSLSADVEQGKVIAQVVREVAGKVDLFLGGEAKRAERQDKVNSFVEVLIDQRDEDVSARENTTRALRQLTGALMGGGGSAIFLVAAWGLEQFYSEHHDPQTIFLSIAALIILVLAALFVYVRWAARPTRRIRHGSVAAKTPSGEKTP